MQLWPFSKKHTDHPNITYLPERQKRFGTGTVAMFLLILFTAGACLLLSPLFQVKTIEVTELSAYTKSEICEKIGLSQNSNSLFFGRGRAERILEKDPYIASAKVSLHLPNTIRVKIQERKVRGYVSYMGSYLYIDENGRVLDVQPAFSDPLPLVEGLSFSSFQLGELLPVTDPVAFEVIVKMAQTLTKYKLLPLVVRLDVSDPSNIRAYIRRVEVRLGDITNYDKKIRTLGEIIANIPEEDRGILDLSDLSKPLVFQYMT